MPKHARRRQPAVTPRTRRFGALLATFALVAAGATLIPAGATTTVGSTETGPHGPVIRNATATITVDNAALMYYRSGSVATVANAAYAPATLNTLKLLKFSSKLCAGDNPATGGKNNTPRTIVTVKDPSNNVVGTPAVSPVRDINPVGGTGGALSPQPLAPNDTNYRGDYAGTGTNHGYTVSVDLTGKPAGVYTVTTVNQNMTKSDSTGPGGVQGTCVIGVPNPATGNKTVIAGPVTTTTTFEYRPWHDTFKDVFGKGTVNANQNPAEFQFTVDTKSSPIYAGTANSMKFYSLPDASSFPLPGDPETCVADPSTCLPSGALQCDPSAGCTPRLMFVNRPLQNAQEPSLVGVFDLQTKAFIAHASNGGTVRTLMSLGTAQDALYKSTLDKLEAAAAAKGIDLASLLATRVGVTSNGQTLSLSLLDALQIDPTGKPGGIQLYTDTTVQAGIILNIYANLSSNTCVTKTASNAGYAAVPKTDRFTRSLPDGYTVTRSDLLPAVPATGPLGAIVGGPVYHILGKFASGATVNTTSSVLGLDTAADAPGGYPVWIEPFVASGHATVARSLDFMGTATWTASETSLGSLGCFSLNFMLGTGVALLNNPYPAYGLGTIFDPLAKPSPAGEKLTDAVNAAVGQAVGQATADPTVSALLAQLTALLPL
ncbi:MAG: hypothetical protein JF565_06935 [Propionibacteriales bacterium]|nr:hypothetical protein [Propionibacteriales bacterium]